MTRVRKVTDTIFETTPRKMAGTFSPPPACTQPHQVALTPGGGAHVPRIYSMCGAGAPHPGVLGSFPVPDSGEEVRE